MSGAHSDLGPELRRLAQAILDGIDPAVRAAAALTAGAGPGTGKCQQVWCPVCALAALATGDEHPLLTVIADHSIALVEAIRGIVNDLNAVNDRNDSDLNDRDLNDSDLNDRDLNDRDLNDRERSPEQEPHPPTDDGPPGGGAGSRSDDGGPAGAKTRYESIPVTVEE